MCLMSDKCPKCKKGSTCSDCICHEHLTAQYSMEMTKENVGKILNCPVCNAPFELVNDYDEPGEVTWLHDYHLLEPYTEEEKLNIISYAVDEYNRVFRYKVLPKQYSFDYMKSAIQKYPNWSMVEAEFCCYGWERECWNEVYGDGVWGMTMDDVKNSIMRILEQADEDMCELQRFFASETDTDINILAVLRDTALKADLRITGSFNDTWA